MKEQRKRELREDPRQHFLTIAKLEELERDVRGKKVKLEFGNREHIRLVRYLEDRTNYREWKAECKEVKAETMWEVTVSVGGSVRVEVEAVTEDEAMDKAERQVSDDYMLDTDFTVEAEDAKET